MSFLFAILMLGQVVVDPYRFAAAAGPSYLINQNFEGAGYDNGETWTENNAAWNEDYTATVLVGSQSLYGISTTSARTDFASFSGQVDVWAYCRFRIVSGGSEWPSGSATWSIFRIANSSGTSVAQLQLRPSNKFRVNGGTSSSDSVGTLSDDTTYHAWLHYTKGTGSDAVITGGISTDGTKPTSGNYFVSLSNGTSTTDAARIYLVCDSSGGVGMEVIFDQILVDETTIGDNP